MFYQYKIYSKELNKVELIKINSPLNDKYSTFTKDHDKKKADFERHIKINKLSTIYYIIMTSIPLLK